ICCRGGGASGRRRRPSQKDRLHAAGPRRARAICRSGRRTATAKRSGRNSGRPMARAPTNIREVKSMRSAEGRGRTLDEAVDAALIELGETRRNVDVRVVRQTPEETVVEVGVIDADAAAAAEAARAASGKPEAEG